MVTGAETFQIKPSTNVSAKRRKFRNTFADEMVHKDNNTEMSNENHLKI